MAAASWLVFLALRSTLVLASALGLERLLRRKPADARHVLLTLAAAGLLLLPALSLLLPRWELEVLPRWAAPASTAFVSSGEDAAPQPSAARETAPAPAATVAHPAAMPAPPAVAGRPSRAPWIGSLLLAAWLVGIAAAFIRLARALRSEGRLRATTRPLSGPWLDTAAEASRALGLSRPVPLLASDAIETPLTSRWPSPAVLLPVAAADWSDERRQVVVQHELVHLARGDAWRLLAWRLVAAVYWFHPLARLAERHARLVGEQACDEAVLRLGTRPSTYARHLMEIAESLRAEPRRLAAALPMVERGQLERRLLMILDPNRSAGRGRTAAAIGLAVLAATVVAVSVAAPLQVAARAPKPATAPIAAAPAPASLGAGMPQPQGETSSASVDRRDDDYEQYDDDGHGDFSMQRGLGDGGRLSVHVDGPVRFDEKDGGVRELGPGSSVQIKTRTGARSQRMTITPAAGGPRYEWWVNGEPRPVDDAARAWLKDALQVVAASREIGQLQGQVGSLQGEIGEVQGEIGSLQGEIGSVQGRIGELQGALGSLQGEQGSLQGEIGSHQGAIGGLEAARSQASSGLAAQLEREIETHEAAIRKLEAELASGELSRRMKEAEAELSRGEAKGEREIAELERKIEALQGDQKIGKLEKQIEDIHADERIREIEKRTQPALDRLKAASRQLGN